MPEIDRSDLMAGNRDTAQETGIPFVNEATNDEALAILRKKPYRRVSAV